MAVHEKVKYYVLNKAIDYRRGFLDRMACTGSGIAVQDGGGYSAFISRVYDSKEEQTIWHRMCLRRFGDEDVPFRISFYTVDDGYVMENEEAVLVTEIIKRPGQQMDIEQKKTVFADYLQFEVENTTDLLLHQVSGRYLWFVLEVYCQPGQNVAFSDIIIYFPRQTWVSYLPSLYDRSNVGDTFLDRYLALFQSLYDDLGRTIDEIPVQLDPDTADEQALGWLASWLGIRNIKIWSAEQLRYLIAHASEMYRKRGTKEGLCDFIELYTGERPFVVEQHKIENFADNEQQYILLRNLYGSDPYMSTILIRASCLPTKKEFLDLQRIIEDIKPAWMAFRMITMHPYILLDNYSYLGVNSVLGEYLPVELDGGSILSFATVGETAFQ